MSEINKGIQISGGTFNADQVAVGDNARAFKTVQTTDQVMPDQKSPIKVLLVFASPHDKDRLQLDIEDRAIHEAIRLSRYRERIALTVRHAATIHDLRRTMLDEEFQIVHIASHGTQYGLNLDDEQGRAYSVPQEALAQLFSAYSNSIRCVILNACYSIAQGKLISLGVAYTIATEGSLGDRAAIEFSRGFYDAIGAGKSIEFAYEEGCRTVQLTATDQLFRSVLLKNRQ